MVAFLIWFVITFNQTPSWSHRSQSCCDVCGSITWTWNTSHIFIVNRRHMNIRTVHGPKNTKNVQTCLNEKEWEREQNNREKWMKWKKKRTNEVFNHKQVSMSVYHCDIHTRNTQTNQSVQPNYIHFSIKSSGQSVQSRQQAHADVYCRHFIAQHSECFSDACNFVELVSTVLRTNAPRKSYAGVILTAPAGQTQGSSDTHGHWLSVEPFADLVNILSLNLTLIQARGRQPCSELPASQGSQCEGHSSVSLCAPRFYSRHANNLQWIRPYAF